jgi:hypothetical protein
MDRGAANPRGLATQIKLLFSGQDCQIASSHHFLDPREIEKTSWASRNASAMVDLFSLSWGMKPIDSPSGRIPPGMRKE